MRTLAAAWPDRPNWSGAASADELIAPAGRSFVLNIVRSGRRAVDFGAAGHRDQSGGRDALVPGGSPGRGFVQRTPVQGTVRDRDVHRILGAQLRSEDLPGGLGAGHHHGDQRDADQQRGSGGRGAAGIAHRIDGSQLARHAQWPGELAHPADQRRHIAWLYLLISSCFAAVPSCSGLLLLSPLLKNRKVFDERRTNLSLFLSQGGRSLG